MKEMTDKTEKTLDLGKINSDKSDKTNLIDFDDSDLNNTDFSDMNLNNINEIRNKIDEIDGKLVKLIEERLEIVENVALYKKRNNIQIFDEKREKEVIEKNLKKVINKEHESYIEMILKDIMKTSKLYQKEKIENE